MFTGIIEATGIIKKISTSDRNRTYWIESPISNALKKDQSISHNGVCLTVEEVNGGIHQVTAVNETLEKTSLKDWKENTLVNLERCVVLGDRLDGHLVQGHVDGTGIIKKIRSGEGSFVISVSFPKKFAALIVEKGSICMDGISLTVFNVKDKSFAVTIIPYTYDHTNIGVLKKGDRVNLEFDIIGKYLLRSLTLKNN